MELLKFKPELQKSSWLPKVIFLLHIRPDAHKEDGPQLLRETLDKGPTGVFEWSEPSSIIPDAICGFQFVVAHRIPRMDPGSGLVTVVEEIARSHRYFPGGTLIASEEEVLKAFETPIPILKLMWRNGWGKIVKSRHGHIYEGRNAVILPNIVNVAELIEVPLAIAA